MTNEDAVIDSAASNEDAAPIETTAVAVRVKEFVPQNEDERMAYHMVKSRFFKDASDVSKAVVKIALGKTLGIDSFSAMTGLFVSQQGKLCMTANLMAYLVKKSGKYDYKAEINEDGAVITFYERDDNPVVARKAWREIGKSSFSKADAKAAGLLTGPNKSNYEKYWRNMSFARAMSNGTKWYTPDAFGGTAVYLPDEIPGSGYEVDGETLEVKSSLVTVAVENDDKELRAAMAACSVGDEWLIASVGTSNPNAQESKRALGLLKIRAKLQQSNT